MGSGELKSSQQKQKTASPQEIIDYLENLFSYALSIGMTYEQYWYDEPSLLNRYVKAEEYRRIRRNQEMWLQGLYVHIAIGDLVPIINPFSKDHKAKPYLKKPIPVSREEMEEQERDKYNRFVDYMMARTKQTEVSKK